jgi:hypothetical protein
VKVGKGQHRGSDVDTVKVGAVVRRQLRGLDAGVGNQAGGAVDDPVLAVLPAPWLRFLTGLQHEVLDLGHGVHGVHERNIPLSGQCQPGETGDPIVGVDEVVAPGPLLPADPFDLRHHAVQQFRQLLFRHFPPWSRCHIVNADPRTGVFDGGPPGVRSAREDVDFDAGFCEG